jgi:hypothetical protein
MLWMILILPHAYISRSTCVSSSSQAKLQSLCDWVCVHHSTACLVFGHESQKKFYVSETGSDALMTPKYAGLGKTQAGLPVNPKDFQTVSAHKHSTAPCAIIYWGSYCDLRRPTDRPTDVTIQVVCAPTGIRCTRVSGIVLGPRGAARALACSQSSVAATLLIRCVSWLGLTNRQIGGVFTREEKKGCLQKTQFHSMKGR